MPAVATYSSTGDAYLDGVLSGVKWGVSTLSFSFPSSASYYGTGYGSGEATKNFEAFTTVQQDAVRKALVNFSQVANIKFTEVTETATVHADLRYAETDLVSTAWAYYPTTAAAGGDAWFNNSKNYYDTPAKGNYAYLTMLHETGHALGLKHPHEARGSFAAMPTDHDSLEYTVMSYRSYIGASTTTGYTNGSTSYPQTLMMYDIAALQKMYGANFTTNAGDSVYSWSALTGQMSINGVGQGAPAGNKIFMTVWDGGGNDTYDFSNHATNLTIDLNPGGWSVTSSAQLATLASGKYAVGNIANALQFQGNAASLIENAIGGSGNDTITGNAANNKLTGGKGNDTLDGGAGTDTAVYSGKKADYSWLRLDDTSWQVSDKRLLTPDGTDKVKNIEYLQFSDGLFQLTTGSTAQTVASTVTTAITQTVNVPAAAVNDGYSISKNGLLTVSAAVGLLANDVDLNGDKLTAKLVAGPAVGTLVLRADGSFDYAAAKNFTGNVSFQYQANDGTGVSNTATVTISVGQNGPGGSGKGAGAEDIHDGHDDHQAPAPAGVSTENSSFVLADALSGGNGHTSYGGVPVGWFLEQFDSAPRQEAFVFHVSGYGGDDITITGLSDALKIYAPDFVFH